MVHSFGRFLVLAFSVIVFARAEGALAQACETEALGDCLYNSGVTCRGTLDGCTDNYQAGMSVPDVQELALTRCCAITGQNVNVRRRACFKLIERNLNIASRNGNVMKPFIRAARRGVIAARVGGCDIGSLD